MTICIAALCDNRKTVVVLADRMLTSSDNTLVFEHDEPKLDKLFNNCIALTAGQATLHQPIFQACRAEIRDTSPLISDVVKKIKEKYQEARREFMNDAIFSTRGLSVNSFYEMQNSLHESSILDFNSAMDLFNLQIDILVAGVDVEENSHIYLITNPGVVIPVDSIGFSSIGTGTRHADVAFAYRQYSSSFPLNKALYTAFEAKKRAEMAGGVGQRTDIAIVTKDGCETLSEDTVQELGNIYSLEVERTGWGNEVNEAVKKLSIK